MVERRKPAVWPVLAAYAIGILVSLIGLGVILAVAAALAALP